jgi:hypothetical protein
LVSVVVRFSTLRQGAGKCRGTAQSVFSADFRGFPKSLQVNTEMVPRIIHYCLLPDPL